MVDVNPTISNAASDEGIIALDREGHIMSCTDASRHLMGLDLYPGDMFTPERVWTGECLQKIKDTLDMAMRVSDYDKVKLRHRPRLLPDNDACYVS